MIQRVLEQAQQVKSLSKVIVATDDERIASIVSKSGSVVITTCDEHVSGTDRCWEAYHQLIIKDNMSVSKSDYIINIPGDEPFINPAQIDELASVLDGTVELATQMSLIDSADILHNVNEVKVIANTQGEALYFSRQAIPFLSGVDASRWHKQHTYFHHIGLYAYRADILQGITQLPPSLLEKAESLEQLRWLEGGYRIKIIQTTYKNQGVNTPQDLKNILSKM